MFGKKKRDLQGEEAATPLQAQPAVDFGSESGEEVDAVIETGSNEDTAALSVQELTAEPESQEQAAESESEEAASDEGSAEPEAKPSRRKRKNRGSKKSRRKSRNDDDEMPVETPVQIVRNKKKSGLATILDESVVDTVWNDFKQNKPFFIWRNGDVGVGLLLRTEDIGGLSKKSRNDEAKGSLVERITAGNIHVLLTQPLIEREAMVFVPDSVTLAALEEYQLLVKAPYELAFVHKNGDVYPTGIPFTFAQARDIIVRDGSIEEYLHLDKYESEDDEEVEDPDAALEEEVQQSLDEGSEDDDEGTLVEDPEPVEPKSGIIEFGDDEEEELLDVDGVEDEFGSSTGEPVAVQSGSELDDDDLGLGDEGVEPESDAAVEDETVFEPENPSEIDLKEGDEIPPELTDKTIVRRFYSDDLNLKASTEAFDAQFLHTNGPVLFDTNRNDGFLNASVSELARDVNADMIRLHNSNLLKARTMYFKLVSAYCENIVRELDASDPNKEYGRIKRQIEDQFQEMLGTLDQKTLAKKDEIEAIWNRTLEQVRQTAAQTAEQEYKDKYGEQHNEELRRVRPQIQAAMEAEFHDNERKLHERRREEAHRRLDAGVTEILNEVDKVYQADLAKEQAKYDEWSATLRSFVDDHLKDEKARIRVLDEEHRQQDKADKVMAEKTEELKAMTQEFEAKKLAWQADTERMIQANEEVISNMNVRFEQERQSWQTMNSELQKTIDELKTRLANLDEQKEQEYQSMISMLRNDRDAWEEKAATEAKIHKRGTRIAWLLAALAIAAALSVGFIAGEWVNLRSDREAAKAEILAELRTESSASSIVESKPESDLESRLESSVSSDVESKIENDASSNASNVESDVSSSVSSESSK